MELTSENKAAFEIFNNFWLLLKPYANDEETKSYKKIMSDIFKLFIKERGNKYTDDWWDTTKDIIDYPDRYNKTKYVDFASDLVIAILDYWQYASKNPVNKCDFMIHVGKAFVYEWERIRDD